MCYPRTWKARGEYLSSIKFSCILNSLAQGDSSASDVYKFEGQSIPLTLQYSAKNLEACFLLQLWEKRIMQPQPPPSPAISTLVKSPIKIIVNCLNPTFKLLPPVVYAFRRTVVSWYLFILVLFIFIRDLQDIWLILAFFVSLLRWYRHPCHPCLRILLIDPSSIAAPRELFPFSAFLAMPLRRSFGSYIPPG